MNAGFHPEARLEFLEAAKYYEACRKGLGLRFETIIQQTVLEIVEKPLRWRTVEKDVHRAIIRGFPYIIFYTVETDGIFIVAVAHGRRRPGYWKDRLKPD